MRSRLTTAALVSGAIAGASVAALAIGRRHQRRLVSSLEERLARAATPSAPAPAADPDLPAPVARYLRWALPDGAARPLVRLRQQGSLRTDLQSPRWMPFSATHLVSASAPGFVWSARVRVAPLLHVRVIDSLVEGVGSGQVALLSAVAVAQDAGTPEMNSGSLHRYLAEAPWYPAALRPSDRLVWTAIDATRALATLHDRGTSVSLEFRFDESGAIAGIYTPGRWGSFAGGYRQRPWEGHFRDYVRHQGVAFPTAADVGWYLEGTWQPVWDGRITGYEPVDGP